MAPEALGNDDGDDDRKNGPRSGLGEGQDTRRADHPPEDSEEEDDEDDEEPRLKYASLTRNLKAVYRNGDATSAFLVAGDKMIIGTHNGNVHVLKNPSLASIRVYHAHSASISSISISPFPPPHPTYKTDTSRRTASTHQRQKSPADGGSPSAKSPQPKIVPLSASNMIYIATASIDGHVCVASLTDQKDVLLRNFARPVQAVALSPEYKHDRAYLSGGLAGSLVLTVGGRAGTSSTSSTTGGAVAQASGWLGSIGLSGNTGKDQILHSGEGAISTIKYSLSGDYVVWVNEQGIKIMRSNLHLETSQTDQAWKRVSHVDHPNRPGWDEMAGIWKAHVEWIDEAGLESEDGFSGEDGVSNAGNITTNGQGPATKTRSNIEKLVVGWSGTIWIINVHRGKDSAGGSVQKSIGRAEVVTILRIDCIISGISLYTPNLLLVLAYVTPEEDASSNPKTTKPGVHRRKNALQPEMRVIDINTKEEVSVADQLTISRYETLSSTDYHLGVLPAVRIVSQPEQHRGTLGAIGGGIEAIGGGLWDATLYPARLLAGNSSIRSGSPGSVKAESGAPSRQPILEEPISALAHGMKIFIHSPYDCILATKPTLTDHFAWLENHAEFQEAWELLDQHPNTFANQPDLVSESLPSSPSKTQGSLQDFFEDDITVTLDKDGKSASSYVQKEKARIGEQWVQQLVSAGKWAEAGRVCAQVLKTSKTWEHWAMTFTRANKFDELTPSLPRELQRPPISPSTYSLVLDHYVQEDLIRFRELLEQWPTELFAVDTVIEAVQVQLDALDKAIDVPEDTRHRNWRLLNESLAKLHLALGHPRSALGCYIRLQDADAAMELISKFHLVSAVADDIAGFISLRVSREAQRTAPVSELAAVTLEPIQLLVSEAHRGIVLPDTVISQLDSTYGIPNPYLYFYFRALWNGEAAEMSDINNRNSNIPQKRAISARAQQAAEERLLVQEGKSLVSDHADTAVQLFAEYDRDLLMQFLKSSATYTLSTASRICEKHGYIPELVYLLAKEGRTAEALRLIIDSLDDVSQAITFAKDQNDASLWDDLLDYAMNKPRFIRGLLEEVGTSIDPLKLVKRIPLGLEIEGLREGLSRMLKDYEVQECISEGVARVLRGEVNQALQERSQGTRRGIKIEVSPSSKKHHHQKKHNEAKNDKVSMMSSSSAPAPTAATMIPGHCSACGAALNPRDNFGAYLLAFPCRHVFHVSCLLRYGKASDYEIPAHYAMFDTSPGSEQLEGAAYSAEEDAAMTSLGILDRAVGPKVDHAALLRDVVHNLGGCPLEDKADTKH